MLLKPDCIPCILKMFISAVRQLTADEELIQELTVEVLSIPSLQGREWNRSSPTVIEQVMERMTKALNNPDPFAAIRRKQNRRGLSLYPTLKRHVEEADDPLQTAVKLAIIGNAIDLMVSDRPPEEENTFPALLRQSLPEGSLAALRKKLAHCRFLVYLGDNAGEIVFDKVLLETIRERYQPRVVYVVRSAPALNDALLSDAEMVKMEEVATVLANGLEAPVPGTILSRCSSELRNLIREADLVISKGGGNFDTLDEEKDFPAPVSFMLLSKCLPYCQRFKTGMFQPILANTFSD